jgi:hypothetical protein
MEAAACAKPATEYTYARRGPEKTALFQVIQQHLLTFEQEWTDKSDGRTLPSFVTGELHDFLGCGILARGLAQPFCPTCHERFVVAWSCKDRGFCPSCGGRRMNAGALTLLDHVLPEVPIRQFVLTVPFPLRFPLAFDGKLLGQVLRIFIDTVAANYRKRLAERGIAGGKYGAVTVIQRANSDLRCDPHVHAIFLDGLCAPNRDGKGFMFQQEDKSPRTLPLSHYISWSELLRRTFAIDSTCPRCKSPLRLIALIKTDDTIKKILSAMGPWACRPVRPNPIPHDRLRLTRAARVEAGSTDGTPTRSRWSGLPRVVETASSGPARRAARCCGHAITADSGPAAACRRMPPRVSDAQKTASK